jgi:hypothetical protein
MPVSIQTEAKNPMSVDGKFESETAQAVTATDARALAPGEGETAALGIAINGFQEVMEGKTAKTALMATKVFLFNAAIFLPLIAMGFLIFS